MKKMFALLLTSVLVFSSLLPFQVSAKEYDLSDHDQLIELAKEVFPEYSDKLNNKSASTVNGQRTLSSDIFAVVQETRRVDESTYLSYTEHNNGVITLSSARYVPSESLVINNSTSGNGYEEFTVTLTGTVLEGSHNFVATNVVYRIYTNAYDRISSAGNYSLRAGNSSSSSNISATIVNRTETASNPARLVYQFPITVGTTGCDGTFVLEIWRNEPSVRYTVGNQGITK